MKATIFLLFILVCSQALHAQNLNLVWAKQMGGSPVGSGISIALDASGNVYTTGVFEGIVDFDPGPGVFNLSSAGDKDIFVSKLNASGNFVWAKRMGGTDYDLGYSIAVDATGNVYTTGYFWGTGDFDPGSGTFNLTSAGNHDVFISKLNSSGNFLWAIQMGDTGADWGRSLTVDPSGNLYTTGEFYGTVDFDPGPGTFNLTSAGIYDIFVQKLDASGNLVWAKNMGGASGDYGFSIKLNGSGNVYVAGAFGDTADFDPGAGTFFLTAEGLFDIFILKLDVSGNFIWAKKMGGIYPDLAYAIEVDVSDNVYSTGIFASTADFDPGPGIFNLTSTTASYWDIFVSKLDVSGNFVWAKQMGGILNDEAHSIAVDASGNVYTTGIFRGTADFDPGPGTFNLTAAGLSEVFISKLDASGNFLWAKQMGASYGGYAIVVNATANIFVTGSFTGTVDFDPGAGVFNLTSFGTDIFVHKLSQCINSTSSNITASACSTYVLNGQTYTSTGVYTQTLINTTGCDSIITLNLTINNRYTTLSAAACDSYLWNGQTYTSTGTYRDTLTATNGCDSIITLNLILKSRSFSTINAAICPGQNYAGYTSAGTYIDTLVAANGCDSIRTLNLTVSAGTFSTIDTTICSGRNYAGYTRTGIYIDTLVTANGCDSIRTIDLTVKNNCGIYIPNAFTPNNNGLNDLFKPIINLPFQQYSFIIFNRYGQKIFETREYGKGWDGTYKGKDQPTGSYVYRITFTNNFGWESVENGSVLLIR